MLNFAVQPPYVLSLFLYDLFLKLYRLGIGLSAREGNKAEKWIKGRKNSFEKMAAELENKAERRIWIHCASLGEFEQGRPLIEAIQHSSLKAQNFKIVLTFFSPSGYEIRKGYEHADYVFYLPLDGKRNAEIFIRLVNPCLAIFVKYEFWYYYLLTLKQKHIPALLVSATFRETQPFFKWYGGFFRKMLYTYTHLFVQSPQSKILLNKLGITEQVTVSGDTRYDRVAAIALQGKRYPPIEQWQGNDKLIVAGSTWKEDETLLRSCIEELPADWKMIIAPHEIHEAHLNEIEKLFGSMTARYSQLNTGDRHQRVLIIDNIGMLSSLYRYGAIAYVGGGFTSGIHNILEPAAFGLPVIFGPNYGRFIEANTMVEKKLAASVRDTGELKHVLEKWVGNNEERNRLSEQVRAFMTEHQGATDVIMHYILVDLHLKRGRAPIND